MRYRLEKLNQVQFADDEIRRKELETKGFQLVSAKAPAVPDKEPAESAAEEMEAEKPVLDKEPAESVAEEAEAEKPAQGKKPAKKTKAAKGEKKDA